MIDETSFDKHNLVFRFDTEIWSWEPNLKKEPWDDSTRAPGYEAEMDKSHKINSVLFFSQLESRRRNISSHSYLDIQSLKELGGESELP